MMVPLTSLTLPGFVLLLLRNFIPASQCNGALPKMTKMTEVYALDHNHVNNFSSIFRRL